MLFANLITALASILLLGASFHFFRKAPIALGFVAILAVGGPLKAVFYDLHLLRKPLDCYPFCLTDFNSVYALVNVLLVLAVLVVWFRNAPLLPNLDFCRRLRPWAVLIFVIYFAWRAPDALENIRVAGLHNHAVATLTTDPIKSALISAQLLWAVATAILVVGARSYWTRALLLLAFTASSLGAASFERSEVVACIICIAALTVQRLHPRLVVGFVLTGVIAGGVGAFTRGDDAMSSQKLSDQIFGDILFLDQSISYVDRFETDLLRPRQPLAFGESFYYGFIPRSIYPTKPAVYGNHQVEIQLAPATFDSGETFDRTGESAGFFPIATWIEMFADFGLPFGMLALFATAWLLRKTLSAARTNLYAWMFTLTIISNALGFFRGGSNWLMMNLKSTLLFAITYAPLEWLIRKRERTVASRVSSRGGDAAASRAPVAG